MSIFYKDVTSSNIAAIAYSDGKAYIEFIGGRRFAYVVDRAIYDQMVDPEQKSIGSFFARHIKKQAPVAWSGWKCGNSPCSRDATHAGVIANVPVHVCDTCRQLGRFADTAFAPIEEPNAR